MSESASHPPKEPLIHPIERLAAALVVLATIAASLLASPRFALGVALGGLLSVLNFWALRTVLRGLMRAQHPPKQAGLALLLMLKFALMGVAIFLLINYAPLDASGLLVGVSIVVLAILIEGFRIAARGTNSSPAVSPQVGREQDVEHG